MILGESQFKHPKYSGSPLRPPTFSSGENGSGGRGHSSMFNVRGNLKRREYILSRNLHGVALGFFRRRGGERKGGKEGSPTTPDADVYLTIVYPFLDLSSNHDVAPVVSLSSPNLLHRSLPIPSISDICISETKKSAFLSLEKQCNGYLAVVWDYGLENKGYPSLVRREYLGNPL